MNNDPSTRKNVRKPVEWAADLELGDLFLTGTIHDVSPEGACFESDHGLDSGRLCGNIYQAGDFVRVGDRLTMRISGWGQASTVVVRWVSGRKVGLEFEQARKAVVAGFQTRVERLDRDLLHIETGANVHWVRNLRTQLLGSFDCFQTDQMNEAAMHQTLDRVTARLLRHHKQGLR